MLKYEPLGDHLRTRPSGAESVTLTFQQINHIILGELPRSAYVHGKQGYWFNNEGSSQGRAWLCAGWEVANLSDDHLPRKCWVTFRRRGN